MKVLIKSAKLTGNLRDFAITYKNVSGKLPRKFHQELYKMQRFPGSGLFSSQEMVKAVH